LWGGMRKVLDMIWVRRNRNDFCKWRLDTSVNSPSGKSADGGESKFRRACNLCSPDERSEIRGRPVVCSRISLRSIRATTMFAKRPLRRTDLTAVACNERRRKRRKQSNRCPHKAFLVCAYARNDAYVISI